MEDAEPRAQALRAAAALIAETGATPELLNLDYLTKLVALGWLSGYQVGAEQIRDLAEGALGDLRANLEELLAGS